MTIEIPNVCALYGLKAILPDGTIIDERDNSFVSVGSRLAAYFKQSTKTSTSPLSLPAAMNSITHDYAAACVHPAMIPLQTKSTALTGLMLLSSKLAVATVQNTSDWKISYHGQELLKLMYHVLVANHDAFVHDQTTEWMAGETLFNKMHTAAYMQDRADVFMDILSAQKVDDGTVAQIKRNIAKITIDLLTMV
jgi:hypothetical protein